MPCSKVLGCVDMVIAPQLSSALDGCALRALDFGCDPRFPALLRFFSCSVFSALLILHLPVTACCCQRTSQQQFCSWSLPISRPSQWRQGYSTNVFGSALLMFAVAFGLLFSLLACEYDDWHPTVMLHVLAVVKRSLHILMSWNIRCGVAARSPQHVRSCAAPRLIRGRRVCAIRRNRVPLLCANASPTRAVLRHAANCV